MASIQGRQGRRPRSIGQALSYALTASRLGCISQSYAAFVTSNLYVECKLTFLDFGMVIARRTENEIWFRGYGINQYVYDATKGPKRFLGGAFAVDSKDKFEM
ncbi:hypothetical protein BDV41DRAFT_569255 [Aspergillus transmontanensis]|uniref:Uncharacterized protein n=1 Tax=Aspergillus transmontanensis TaxID=1034304 RepID=A0A5N6VGE5_9EURO|nr:hypothetical protein BDV41DRAFT_569255 [Aspergillus transmontanensis]